LPRRHAGLSRGQPSADGGSWGRESNAAMVASVLLICGYASRRNSGDKVCQQGGKDAPRCDPVMRSSPAGVALHAPLKRVFDSCACSEAKMPSLVCPARTAIWSPSATRCIGRPGLISSMVFICGCASQRNSEDKVRQRGGKDALPTDRFGIYPVLVCWGSRARRCSSACLMRQVSICFSADTAAANSQGVAVFYGWGLMDISRLGSTSP